MSDLKRLALRSPVISLLLDELNPPAEPFDGACLAWAPHITQRLVAACLAAETVNVFGWHDRAARVLSFLHRATLLDKDIVIDCTARQFHPEAPSRWVTPVADYCAQLATLTGISEVSIEPTQPIKVSSAHL